VEGAIAIALSAFGRLDCAVNSAGITGAPGTLDRIDLEGWTRTAAVENARTGVRVNAIAPRS